MSVAALTLDLAETIAATAMTHGHEQGFKPLTICVTDAGGHIVLLKRSDGSSNMRPDIALAKANGALCLGVSSRTIGEMAADRPTFISSLGPISPAGIVPAAGGVIFENAEGVILGAVGITGDTSDNDEACALAGIAAAGLAARN